MTADELAYQVKNRASKSGLFDMTESNYVDFQIHAAIYAFASLNHSGQYSELYEVLSSSPFLPGPLWRETEEEESNEFYQVVESVAEKLALV